MRYEHLFSKAAAPLSLSCRGYDLGGDACQIAPSLAVFRSEDERHEGGAALDDIQAELLRQSVAEAGGPHLWDR